MIKKGDQAFVAYPDAVIWAEPGGPDAERGQGALNHLIWGDWMRVLEEHDNWLEVVSRKKIRGFIRREKAQAERILEVNFVDVGQGDGCHIVTPDDQVLIIDAGETDNMYRFLRWRYGGFEKGLQVHSAVITHPDQDHYLGFQELFDEPRLRFKHVFHNGIVERVAGAGELDELGPREGPFLTGVIQTREQLKLITDVPQLVGRKRYPRLLKTAIDSDRFGEVTWLAREDPAVPAYLPGFEAGERLSLEVLGPVPERDAEGKVRLRVFENSKGPTKNGHSVVLRLVFGKISLLLGGDLNIPAEHHLLWQHTGLKMPPRDATAEEEAIRAARAKFSVDIAKACHHGSADFSEIFLQAINPVATVVSSGDNESHAHPRPDTLGALGKFSRGRRPLIFSTELARSASEQIEHPSKIRQQMKAALAIQADVNASETDKKEANREIGQFFEKLERSIARYGMINLRSDGDRVLMAQKLETYRSQEKKWDLHRLEREADGELRYVSKYSKD